MRTHTGRAASRVAAESHDDLCDLQGVLRRRHITAGREPTLRGLRLRCLVWPLPGPAARSHGEERRCHKNSPILNKTLPPPRLLPVPSRRSGSLARSSGFGSGGGSLFFLSFSVSRVLLFHVGFWGLLCRGRHLPLGPMVEVQEAPDGEGVPGGGVQELLPNRSSFLRHADGGVACLELCILG